jgi:arylsulfatase A-like enzyme
LAAACAAPEPPAEPAIRLVEQGAAVEVVWPEAAEPPEDLAVAHLGNLPPPGVVAEIEMFRGAENRDSRAALLAPAGSAYRFRLRLPSEPLLRLALGHLAADDGTAAEVTFRVAVAAGGGGEMVFEERRETHPEDAWLDREIPLGAWAGRDVTLVLETAAPAGGPPVWAAWGTPEVTARGRRPPGWDVILISLDTLRADRLGCYGYHRPTSPALDALAAGGVRFATAVAQAPWTRPSHWSLFNSLYPASHGGRRPVPLALLLWRAGYRTAAITGGGQVDRNFGFHTGFETYRIHYWVQAIDEVVRHLEAGRDRRNFLFLHTYEIHDPYTHPRFAEGLPAGRIEGRFSRAEWQRWKRQLTAEEKTYVEALYDGGVAYTDAQLGRLFGELEQRGLLDRSIVIVTSDHGEQLWEHGGWRHGSTLYDHQLLVPLIIHLPRELRRQLGGDLRGRVVAQQAQLIDLYPTVLDLLGIELDHEIQGRSLVPLLAGGEMPPRKAFSENTNVKAYERKSIRSERFKYIRSIPRKSAPPDAGEYFELYDLRKDPAEQVDLAGSFPELAAALKEEMRALREREGQLLEEVPEGISPELRRQLEALGYFAD